MPGSIPCSITYISILRVLAQNEVQMIHKATHFGGIALVLNPSLCYLYIVVIAPFDSQIMYAAG